MQGYVAVAGGLLPFVVLLVILLATKRSLVVASAAFLFVTTAITTLVWNIRTSVLFGAAAKGFLVSLDIALVVAGSLLFLDVLKKTRVLSSLEHYLHRTVPDSRVQAILLVWLFGALLEGAAGFGTPAAVIAPLLVHLGFSAVAAASLALVANTVPVSFGAVGTPLRVGLEGIPQGQVSPILGTFGLVLSVVVPIILVKMISREIHPRQGVIGLHGMSHAVGDEGATPSSIVPFALWAGLSFGIPYWLISRVSPELPSLLGALIALFLTFFFSVQPWWRKLFLPAVTQRISTYDPNELPLHWWRVVTPYVLMVVLLVLGRMYLPSFVVQLAGGISQKISLFNPGIIMLILAAAYALIGKLTKVEVVHTARSIGIRMVRMMAIICMLVAAIQLYINSGQNGNGYESMLHSFGYFLRRENVALFSPFVGMLAGFAAGSTTVANLMFGQIQWNIAQTLGVSTLIVIALQVFGATAGNALSLSNISAIEGALDIKHRSRAILKKLLLPVGQYTFAIIVLGGIAAMFM